MTDFSTAITSPSRTLSIRATLTLATGYAYSLTGDDILAYSLNEGASGGSMLLGSALSAHATLTLASPNGAWRPGGSKLGNRTLMMDQGRIVFDTAGKERACLTVEDLLEKFREASGRKLDHDRMWLG